MSCMKNIFFRAAKVGADSSLISADISFKQRQLWDTSFCKYYWLKNLSKHMCEVPT